MGNSPGPAWSSTATAQSSPRAAWNSSQEVTRRALEQPLQWRPVVVVRQKQGCYESLLSQEAENFFARFKTWQSWFGPLTQTPHMDVADSYVVHDMAGSRPKRKPRVQKKAT